MKSLSNFLEKHPDLEPTSNPLVLIPTFNNGVYLENCISQLVSLGFDRYLVLDGGSTEWKTLQILHQLAEEGRVITLPHNPGPRYFFEDRSFFDSLPEIFCVTDPDLQFNQELPGNFLASLLLLSEELQIGKVGFALSLEGKITSEEFFTGGKWIRVIDWESQFWRVRISNSLGLEAYRAQIDTTFAVYNKKFLEVNSFFTGVRVAGKFTAEHLPWYPEHRLNRNLRNRVISGPHSTWNQDLSKARERAALEYALSRIEHFESSFSWKITAPLRLIHRFGRKMFRGIARTFRH